MRLGSLLRSIGCKGRILAALAMEYEQNVLVSRYTQGIANGRPPFERMGQGCTDTHPYTSGSKPLKIIWIMGWPVTNSAYRLW